MAKYRIPSLISLHSFEAAARHQSIQKAADELRVTHATVSRHVRRLETLMGRPLLHRTHHGVELTNFGALLYTAVERALTLIQRAIGEVTGRFNLTRLVISSDPDFAALWLMPRLSEFYSLLPGTAVEIIAERTRPSPQDSRVGCAIHYAQAGQRSNGELLCHSHLFPVGSPDLFKASPLRSVEDLVSQRLLHDRSFDEWREYCRAAGLSGRVDAGVGSVFTTTLLCYEAARWGHGVALGDDVLSASLLAAGRLVRPLTFSVPSRSAYYLVVAEGAATHPALRVFTEWLLRSTAQHRQERAP